MWKMDYSQQAKKGSKQNNGERFEKQSNLFVLNFMFAFVGGLFVKMLYCNFKDNGNLNLSSYFPLILLHS